MLLPLLLAAAAGAAASAPPASAPPAPVVIVRGAGFTGSGVVWDAAARRVLTALHVVEGIPAGALQVVVRGGALAARVVDAEAALDLALLEVAGPLEAGPPLGATSGLSPGDRVAVASCPRSRCAQGDGLVLAPTRAFAGSRYLAISAEARPGASGGAVLDAQGAVVGIVDLALLKEPGVALAVPVERAVARFPRG